MFGIFSLLIAKLQLFEHVTLTTFVVHFAVFNQKQMTELN